MSKKEMLPLDDVNKTALDLKAKIESDKDFVDVECRHEIQDGGQKDEKVALWVERADKPELVFVFNRATAKTYIKSYYATKDACAVQAVSDYGNARAIDNAVSDYKAHLQKGAPKAN